METHSKYSTRDRRWDTRDRSCDAVSEAVFARKQQCRSPPLHRPSKEKLFTGVLPLAACACEIWYGATPFHACSAAASMLES
jgi:hypothetical protein